MKKVILDFDNTMGLKQKDVTAGLAFLFLVGSSEIDLMALTSVFGNSNLENTYQTTEKMINDFNLKNKIPHFKGAAKACDLETKAAQYLAQTAAENKNEITLIAIGPLTNLYAAAKIDPDFFRNLKEIIIMGGITEKIEIANQLITDLNFSLDPTAAEKVLKAEVPVALLSRNLALAARFGEKSWRRIKRSKNKAIRAYIKKEIESWYQYSSEVIGLSGFYMWDLVAVVYFVAPELFAYNKSQFVSSVEDLKSSTIKTEKTAAKLQSGAVINLPSIIVDTKRFKNIVFRAWDQIDFSS